jgi:hypothetical protein
VWGSGRTTVAPRAPSIVLGGMGSLDNVIPPPGRAAGADRDLAARVQSNSRNSSKCQLAFTASLAISEMAA